MPLAALITAGDVLSEDIEIVTVEQSVLGHDRDWWHDATPLEVLC